jgi:hypothetical protein
MRRLFLFRFTSLLCKKWFYVKCCRRKFHGADTSTVGAHTLTVKYDKYSWTFDFTVRDTVLTLVALTRQFATIAVNIDYAVGGIIVGAKECAKAQKQKWQGR